MTPAGVENAPARRRQVRRAWAFLSTAALAFALLCSALFGAGYWYLGHATVKQLVCVDVVQGDRAFVRAAYQLHWSAVPRRSGSCASRALSQGPASVTYLREGDTLKTEDGTRVFLTLWDGSSTVEVFERAQLKITELRTTQYMSRAGLFSMEQTRGLVRVGLAPGDYSRSRFQVVAGDTTVVMKEGGQRTGGGSFLVEVKTGADGESVAAVRASVRRGVGAVRVAGTDAEVRLGANEQTTVPAGGVPGPPTPARRDLVANGLFVPSSDGLGNGEGRFAHWQKISTPGQAGGGFGQLRPVTETIDGQPVSALEVSRSLDSTDPANTGLRQPLDVSVAYLVALELTADVKVLEQNLPAGGQAGSEYPIIVRINYRDIASEAQHVIWGFSLGPDPPGVKPAAGRAELVPAGEWSRLRIDLRTLTPQPVQLDSIEVYASGHGYRARITNVAIIGTE